MHEGKMEKHVTIEKDTLVASLNKIADILDARLEEISNKLDDITASIQSIIIDEEGDEEMEE